MRLKMSLPRAFESHSYKSGSDWLHYSKWADGEIDHSFANMQKRIKSNLRMDFFQILQVSIE